MTTLPFLSSEARAVRDKLKFIYKGGKTKRFHTADTLTEQSVGEHSFGVAWLVFLINPRASRELILAALAHDLAEHIVGDVSSPTKRAYPTIKAALDGVEYGILKDMGFDFEHSLTAADTTVLKIADMLDGMMFCVRERRMGSKVVIDIYDNFKKYVFDLTKNYNEDSVHELILTINLMWEKYNV